MIISFCLYLLYRGDAKIWKPKITDDFGSSPGGGVNVSLAADKQVGHNEHRGPVMSSLHHCLVFGE